MKDLKNCQMVIMERKSSIDDEPRTLYFDQLQYAREAAEYVVNTSSIEEALRIFTEGLEPVGNCAGKNQNTAEDISSTEQVGCCCNEIRIPRSRDIATAPF